MSVQKFDHRSDKRLWTGTSGTGKTTLFEKMLRSERARLKFVFDHQGEFSARFDLTPVLDADGLCEATAKGGWVCFDPVKMSNEATPEGKRRGVVGSFNFFCDFVLAVSEKIRGRKIFACDELQKLIGTREDPQELLAVLDTGRRYQLDFFAISQAPNRIHNGVRNQLTHVYTFRQSDANAITYLAENGFDAEAVRNLPRGKYLWRNLDSGEAGEGGEAF